MRTILNVLKKNSFYFFVAGAFALSSCGGNQENKQTNAVDSLAQANEQAIQEAETIIKSFPTPFQLTKMLNDAGASYILDVSNPVESAEKYTTVKSKALNWGIYGADLCYAATYNKKQETTKYLVATQKLTEKLEIANAVDKSMQEKLEENFKSKDSLINMFTKQFAGTYEKLNESGRSNIATISIAGATIEGLFISTQLAAFAAKNDELKKVIAGQKDVLKKLGALLGLYKDNEDIQEIALKIKDINAIFDNVAETLTDEQLKNLSTKIESIRNEYIK
ncbi:MAG: hypothetical protein A2275_04440 [Bacteroidetes bacterium RIFOXYA12_FULL_35_11]|nr:MAG: hypothetical protein A2X01_07780 [Bacteroidetes bacterium GWF2_35_48]OFY75559.1 MAG: hypothetical protein A2275_04440 [Bacteroidetes bacterium RIFOXYA12_FULL_35_11]OFY94270.1 MAG: hypothetical protein A2309_01620 [Bacteroidetes bacterium RIFOXYB2_FULL_35_7]HBX49805.1 hypothetical protein [Bacteroidales bacterium]